MTDASAQLEAIVDTLGCLGVTVRRDRLGGLGGGLCVVGGARVLFLDVDADVATQLSCGVSALAEIPEVDGIFLVPALRDQIDRLRESAS